MTFARLLIAMSSGLVMVCGCSCAQPTAAPDVPFPIDGGALDGDSLVDGGGSVLDANTLDGGEGEVPGDDAPAAAEPCNQRDDDGDGRVDEGCSCSSGTSQPCFVGAPELAGIGVCTLGTQGCVSDMEFGSWGVCEGSGVPGPEVCDNDLDDDCDGVADEDCTPSSCAAGDIPEPEVCRNGADEDCDGFIDESCETGRVVGRAVPYGNGRIVVWGDEHVTFDSYGDAARPFWARMLGWLACEDCAVPGTVVATNRGLPPSVVSDAALAGLTVRSTGGFDPTADVVILVGDTRVDPDALADWVWAGGGLMVLSVGLGDRFECDSVNSPLFELPLRFDCSTPNPWGPVATVFPHPSTLDLVPDNAPFVNGRWVVEDPDTRSTVLAVVAP